MKTLITSTTTILLGMNLFATPVQAAVGASQSEAALDKKVVQDQGTDNTNKNTDPTVEKSSIYEDNTAVKDENGNDTTIGEVAKNQHENNALGLAGMFGIFSKKTSISADANSNIATKEYVKGNEFGTRGDSHNLSNKDVTYIEKADDIGTNAFRTGNNVVVLGKDSNATKNGDQVNINGNRMDHLNANDFRKESEINPDKKYIDIDTEFEELKQRSDYFSKQKTTDGVKINLSNVNDQWIDVSNAKPDNHNAVYVDLDANILNAAQPITIKGLADIKNSKNLKGSPVVIVNVRTKSNNGMVAGTQTKLVYGSEIIDSQESHNHSNHVLWNFGNDLSELNVSSGRFVGSILAPNATVNAGVNIDGNIVADTVNITGGENHHWDLHPGNSFIEIVKPNKPSTPDKPITPDKPSTPDKPTTPDKPSTPDKPTIPDKPSTPDKPTTPDKPSTPDKPTTPDKPSTPDKPTTPDKPSTPDKPTTPDKPSTPDKPTTPDKPSTPDKPTTPDTPNKPDKPNKPFVPPFFPAYPVVPPKGDTPDKPDKPVTPILPTPDKPSTPETPVVPGTNVPDQPETPQFDKPQAKKPLRDDDNPEDNGVVGTSNDKEIFFSAQSKKVINSTSGKKVVNKDQKPTAINNSKVENSKPITAAQVANNKSVSIIKTNSVKSTTKETAKTNTGLPQTGEKQEHLALMGAIISISTLVIGMFGRLKRR